MQKNLKTAIFAYIDHETEIIIEERLKNYLDEIGKSNLFFSISYVLKEVVANANKANLKRAYFTVNNLDLESVDDYKTAMKKFRDEIYTFDNRYISAISKLGLYVKIDFFIEENKFIMSIINKTKILPVEHERILDRIKNTHQFTSIDEVLEQGMDTEEGAGFGIFLILLSLRKIGLDESAFKVLCDDNSTNIRIEIPLSLMDQEEEEFVAKTAMNEIKDVPQFPQHIMELQKLLSNPNSNFTDLSHIINRDPALIADLLKIANSSLYMLPNRVKTIEQAVRQIGFKGIKDLVLTYSVEKLLADKYDVERIKYTINHSSEVALYAYELARIYKLREIKDEIYTAAILHDIGKIVIKSLKPVVLEKIEKLCVEKGLNPNFIENLTDGFNHSLIGALLAKKWNFPDTIVEAIRYHHTPARAKENNKKLVSMIFLADAMFYYKRNKLKYTDINYQLLDQYNLSKKEHFDKIFKFLATTLEQRKKMKQGPA